MYNFLHKTMHHYSLRYPLTRQTIRKLITFIRTAPRDNYGGLLYKYRKNNYTKFFRVITKAVWFVIEWQS
jgi:hypothetical protein